LKLRLPVSALREKRWNPFTWLLFLGLILAFGWLSETSMRAWSWAWEFARLSLALTAELPPVEAEVRIGRHGTAPVPVFLAAMLWVAYIIPLTLTVFPAVCTVYFLAKWKEHSISGRLKKRRYRGRWPIF
jgi:hypothetical protein